MEPSRIASTMFLITPSDSATFMSIGLRANTAGTVRFQTSSSQVIDLTVAAGEVIPVIVTKVFAAGTTAQVHGFA